MLKVIAACLLVAAIPLGVFAYWGLMTKAGANRGLSVFGREQATREIEATESKGAKLVTCGEPDYPHALKEIDSAPPVLCMSGNLELASRDSVGIVASLGATDVTVTAARRLDQHVQHVGRDCSVVLVLLDAQIISARGEAADFGIDNRIEE